jgi:type II secretory pathway pseudopilin PulG
MNKNRLRQQARVNTLGYTISVNAGRVMAKVRQAMHARLATGGVVQCSSKIMSKHSCELVHIRGRLSLPLRASKRHAYPAFTLVEMLLIASIMAVLCSLAYAVFSAATQQARKANEIGAAKSLITAYLAYPLDHNGSLMVGHYEGGTPDLDEGSFELPNGDVVSGAELHRYPFRLAPYMEGKIDGTILVNRNTDQIRGAFSSSQFNYGASLCPAMGINYYYVGGLSTGGEVSGAADCATTLSQVQSAESLLVFASAFTEVGGKKIDGRYGVEPPNYRTRLWDANLHVDARYGGKAVCAFLDGSVRTYTIEELRDMRLWSMRAAMLDDENYVVKASSSGGIGGGGGGRGGRR